MKVTLNERLAISNCLGTVRHLDDKIVILEVSDNKELAEIARRLHANCKELERELTELDRLAATKY